MTRDPIEGTTAMIFDTEKNVVFTDAQIAKFAELQIAGEETTLTKGRLENRHPSEIR